MYMPSDPPYPPDTVVAGIKFRPGTLDIRLYLSVSDSSIRSCDFNITLINTTGQILGIYDIRQRSESPNILSLRNMRWLRFLRFKLSAAVRVGKLCP